MSAKKVSRGNTSDLIGLWNNRANSNAKNLLQIPNEGSPGKFRKSSAAVTSKTLGNREPDRFRKSSALVLLPITTTTEMQLNVDKSSCYKPMKNVSGLEDASHLPKLRSILEMPPSSPPQIQMEDFSGKLGPRRDSVGLGRSKSVCHHRSVKFMPTPEIRKDSTESGQHDSNTPNDHPASRLTRQASLPTLTDGNETRQKKGETKPATRSSTAIMRSPSSAKEVILAWVQERTDTYPNLKVTNFSTSWNDGMAFCALIHFYYPEAFDYDKLDPKNRRYNFDLAFKAAEHFADICPLLDVEDMVMMMKPDWKCVFTYVQTFYRRFRNGRDPQSPTRKLTLTPPSLPGIESTR